MIPSFFNSRQKLKKPRSFSFEPRFYDAQKEALEEKIKKASTRTPAIKFQRLERKDHYKLFRFLIAFVLAIAGVGYVLFLYYQNA